MNSMTLHHVHWNVQLWSPAASKRAHQRSYVAVSWSFQNFLVLKFEQFFLTWNWSSHYHLVCSNILSDLRTYRYFQKGCGTQDDQNLTFIASTKPSNQIKDCSCRSSLRQDEVHTRHTYCIHTYSMQFEESSQVFFCQYDD